MKWIVTITSTGDSSGYPTEVYDFNAEDEEAAKEKAVKCFHRYAHDTCQDYDREEDLPVVIMYEAPKDPIWIDIIDAWKAEREGVIERREAAIEKTEREAYDRLKKKFGDK